MRKYWHCNMSFSNKDKADSGTGAVIKKLIPVQRIRFAEDTDEEFEDKLQKKKTLETTLHECVQLCR